MRWTVIKRRHPLRAAIEAFGRIDVPVNNVGGPLSARDFDVDQDPFTCDDGIVEAVFAVNFSRRGGRRERRCRTCAPSVTAASSTSGPAWRREREGRVQP